MRMTLAFAALLLAAQTCGTGSTMVLELTTEGGIAGRGVGSIAVDARKVTAGDLRRTCTGILTASEEARIRELLGDVSGDAWQSYGGVHADAIGYRLAAGERIASWYGEDPRELPEPLHRLRAELWAVRDRVLRDCPQ
jgi:hypothetical protein